MFNLAAFERWTPGNNRYRCFLSNLTGLAALPPPISHIQTPTGFAPSTSFATLAGRKSAEITRYSAAKRHLLVLSGRLLQAASSVYCTPYGVCFFSPLSSTYFLPYCLAFSFEHFFYVLLRKRECTRPAMRAKVRLFCCQPSV